MAMLEPSLSKTAPKAGNFRGVRVYNGLGIVWFVWLVSFLMGAQLLVLLNFELPWWAKHLEQLFPVLAGSCAFGLFDDWAGSHQIKGFKGHLKALAHGQLTTGGLKFLGIGFLSLFLAISLFYDGAGSILKVVLVTCIVALGANLMNLFDLRPGRAGKMYLLGLLIAVICIVSFGMIDRLGWLGLLALVLAALGPLVAVWHFDLGEKGMLGDAGANSMGVFLGFLFATSLPIWGLAVLAVGLAAVNLLSERISFTRIIEGNRFLSTLDELGRPKTIGTTDIKPDTDADTNKNADRNNYTNAETDADTNTTANITTNADTNTTANITTNTERNTTTNTDTIGSIDSTQTTGK